MYLDVSKIGLNSRIKPILEILFKGLLKCTEMGGRHWNTLDWSTLKYTKLVNNALEYTGIHWGTLDILDYKILDQ